MRVRELMARLKDHDGSLPVVLSTNDRGDRVIKQIKIRGLDVQGDIQVLELSAEEMPF